MKYIIYWCIVNQISINCPSWTTIDEFGVKTEHESMANCYKLQYDCNHSKVFYNRDSAIHFYNEGIKRQNQVFNNNLDSVRIDSIKTRTGKAYY